MYDELIKRLRSEAVYLPEKFSKNAELLDVLMKAADAIEQLTADLERSKEWEAFWEKEANEALKKYQTTVANKPRWIPVQERLPQETQRCIVVSKCGEMAFAIYNETGFQYPCYMGKATHWMPLPQAPKED